MSRILGIDYGRRRVGLAVSDEDEGFAFPHAVLDVQSSGEAVNKVAACCQCEGIGRIVVGLPMNMDGSEGPMAAEVREFASALARRTKLVVEFYDERLSSYSAEQVLIEADVSRRKRKSLIDKLAAQQILQSYLEAREGGRGAP